MIEFKEIQFGLVLIIHIDLTLYLSLSFTWKSTYNAPLEAAQ